MNPTYNCAPNPHGLKLTLNPLLVVFKCLSLNGEFNDLSSRSTVVISQRQDISTKQH